jgi:uncharacterized membrane protein
MSYGLLMSYIIIIIIILIVFILVLFTLYLPLKWSCSPDKSRMNTFIESGS